MGFIPEGYISVVEAWEALSEAVPELPVQAFTLPFESRALEAFVRASPDGDNIRLLPDDWRAEFFAERVFLSDAIRQGVSDSRWNDLVGLAPFVRESDFKAWLSSAVRRCDPKREPFWTLPMTVAWIGARSVAAVRDQWPMFRDDCGKELPASILLLEALEQGGTLTGYSMTVSDAWLELCRSLGAGSISAVAIVDDCETTIEPHAWAHMVREGDVAPLRDRFRNRDLTFTDIKVPSAEVLKRWAEDDASPMMTTQSPPPSRLPAFVKQEIAQRLDWFKEDWKARGEGKDWIGVREFIAAVTDPDSSYYIPDAKPHWARKIWDERRPDQWSARGPR